MYSHQLFSLWTDARKSAALPQIMAKAFTLPGAQTAAVTLADSLNDAALAPALMNLAKSSTANADARAAALDSLSYAKDAAKLPDFKALAENGRVIVTGCLGVEAERAETEMVWNADIYTEVVAGIPYTYLRLQRRKFWAHAVEAHTPVLIPMAECVSPYQNPTSGGGGGAGAAAGAWRTGCGPGDGVAALGAGVLGAGWEADSMNTSET